MSRCQWCGRETDRPYCGPRGGTERWCGPKCYQEERDNASGQSIFQGTPQASPDDQAQAAVSGCIGTIALAGLACMVGLFFLPYLIYGWLFHGMTFSVESVINCFGNIWAWVISIVFWLIIATVIEAFRNQQSNGL
jgi:hypothetical protein